jgi:hypothetical protein
MQSNDIAFVTDTIRAPYLTDTRPYQTLFCVMRKQGMGNQHVYMMRRPSAQIFTLDNA